MATGAAAGFLVLPIAFTGRVGALPQTAPASGGRASSPRARRRPPNAGRPRVRCRHDISPSHKPKPPAHKRKPPAPTAAPAPVKKAGEDGPCARSGGHRRREALRRSRRFGASRVVDQQRGGGGTHRSQRIGEDDLLRMAAGLLEPTEGSLEVFGQPAGSLEAAPRSPISPTNPRSTTTSACGNTSSTRPAFTAWTNGNSARPTCSVRSVSMQRADISRTRSAEVCARRRRSRSACCVRSACCWSTSRSWGSTRPRQGRPARVARRGARTRGRAPRGHPRSRISVAVCSTAA